MRTYSISGNSEGSKWHVFEHVPNDTEIPVDDAEALNVLFGRPVCVCESQIDAIAIRRALTAAAIITDEA